jgi:hypothetical protein
VQAVTGAGVLELDRPSRVWMVDALDCPVSTREGTVHLATPADGAVGDGSGGVPLHPVIPARSWSAPAVCATGRPANGRVGGAVRWSSS